MKKNKVKKRICRDCDRWYNGCYDTDYEFWSGKRDANDCKAFKQRVFSHDYFGYLDFSILSIKRISKI